MCIDVAEEGGGEKAGGAVAVRGDGPGLGGERDDELILRIEGYNRDDCISVFRLRSWLEQIRDGLIANGAQIERPALGTQS